MGGERRVLKLLMNITLHGIHKGQSVSSGDWKYHKEEFYTVQKNNQHI